MSVGSLNEESIQCWSRNHKLPLPKRTPARNDKERTKTMKCPARLMTMLPVILLMTASLESEMVSLVQVDNKPSDKIDIIPIDDAHRSRVPPSLADLAGLPAGSFILANRTATSITAVVVRWTYTDLKGNLQQSRINCDAYVFAPLEPIVNPNDVSLITPHGCVRQDVFPRLTAGGTIGSPLHQSTQTHPPADPHATVHLYVDSVVFEDGRIWGPDKLDYTSEINDRYAAVRKFVSEVTVAKDAGESMPSLLSRIRGDVQGKTDKPSSRRAYYAGLLQRSPNPEGTLQQLKAQTSPPPFRHIGEL